MSEASPGFGDAESKDPYSTTLATAANGLSGTALVSLETVKIVQAGFPPASALYRNLGRKTVNRQPQTANRQLTAQQATESFLRRQRHFQALRSDMAAW